MSFPDWLQNNSSTLLSLAFFILAAGILFFFFILPDNKKKKQDKKFLSDLKVGDRIVSIGGIHGIIIDTNGDQLLLQLKDGSSQLLLEQQAISREATIQIYRKTELLEENKQKKGKKK